MKLKPRQSFDKKPNSIVEIPKSNGLYFCSTDGKVFSAPKLGNGFKWIELRPSFVNGYLNVKVKRDGQVKTCILHRLIAITFIPNPKNKKTVNHKNGIKTDNRVENLEWATRKENTQHAYDTGLKIGISGEKNGMSKVTSKEVLEIVNSPLSIYKLSKIYEINPSSISAIKTGRQWSKVTGIKFTPFKTLTKAVVLKVFNSLLSGKELSKKYNIPENTISSIRTGRNWTWLTKKEYIKKHTHGKRL